MIIDTSQIDYSALDRPEILMLLFHPRPEWEGAGTGGNAREVLIPVEKDVVIGGRFHMVEKPAPNILFFHGNGEIVADYDEMGPLYNRMGMNFLPVDYRGYGRSTGSPTITAMMRDCHTIFDYAREWLKKEGFSGRFILMGRSLGSASVLELSANYRTRVDGLVVESGFAYAGPLLQLLGINLAALGFKEEQGFRNIDKIMAFDKPTLIIHAEHDHIIPFSDAQALYDASPAPDKTLLKIPMANHNDIFARGLSEYMQAVRGLCTNTM
ncbi:MAG: alpha/beta hydrolase [Proteobacteria bacterium]|nr:alpha/beta hydrolase [Pseudomonadota bacterium]MBU0990174.1 alpha/beta hydrolase [Pseudomonadota bacterium]MBU1902193.1 alpha/beta hydrolase [Pseudomonadota bacterium]